MPKLIIPTTDYKKVLQRVCEADPVAFYVGQEKQAVSGGTISAKWEQGKVTVTSNRLSEDRLRELFAEFIPEDIK